MHILILSGGEPEGTIGSDAAISFKFIIGWKLLLEGKF